ncbi:LacI family transcriptional regulator [Occultella glacieicola]|uniref:LacI family transcriptional regulator n=1 Tax=Occultella glacieicola TaxID=2518684 RepID=A0ABY2E4N1_9MICO|nr:LacI family DNA-binding transcriptional regulator [Occultella glacieicola]TDE94980.1 LacI family transcriptional regulator [Occultella glacieicola]
MTDADATGPATVRSVARAAGVSVATVSRVMAGTGVVSPERTERVLAAARRLGYTPSPIARSLATGTSRRVAVVVPNLSNPYFYDIIRGIGRASAADGYTMTVADSMEDATAEAALATDMLAQADALVLVAPRADRAVLRELQRSRRPVLMLLGPRAEAGLPDLGVDNLGGMTMLYRHLAEIGHRRVVYLSGPPGAWQNRRRLEAARRAERFGVEVTVLEAGGTIAAGHDAADAALTHGPTAIACFNDLVAFGVLNRLTERGIGVPTDVSLTGFDDIDFSAYSSPALTTVRTPRERLGSEGWHTLRRMIDGEAVDPAPEELAAELVVRDSTGSVQASA